ncbi:type IV fimbrial biogenesis protein FimT [Variovorax sp. W1I1]|uniref:GspH/FimT family pseudopilin n=1 Tax=Variovorax sp. W1I1 TaxID=3042309 RepID=UPI00278078DB|nr:GspH/FimT family pseudopilin [Variovorax sp. W1I1]MDQ0611432.1 type IV fimbrial biogenesis protein FimT [Variovorax sp. W1I1]
MKSSAYCREKGFTLIELMVGVALLGVLFMLAYPSYTSFIQNAQIRTAADSVINGLQLARAEAIRRNSNVQFRLLNTSGGVAVTGGTDWQIAGFATATSTTFDDVVQTRRESSTSSNARLGVANSVSSTQAAPGAGMPADIVFTAVGRLSNASAVRQIDVSGATGARRLTVVLAPGGDVRLCDPGLSLSTNPQGCS